MIVAYCLRDWLQEKNWQQDFASDISGPCSVDDKSPGVSRSHVPSASHGWDRHTVVGDGAKTFKHLNMVLTNVNIIGWQIRNQCSLYITGVMWSDFLATDIWRADGLWITSSFCYRCWLMPYNTLLQQLNWLLANVCTITLPDRYSSKRWHDCTSQSWHSWNSHAQDSAAT